MHFVLFLIFRGITVNKQGEIDSIQGDTTPCSAEKNLVPPYFWNKIGPSSGRFCAVLRPEITAEYGRNTASNSRWAVPKLWRGKVCLFWENAFGKSAITFHPLNRFCQNIACFKGNLFRSQKIFWVLEFTVFSWNDVITKLKILITLLGAPELFQHI
jgi:hypothetical protein